MVSLFKHIFALMNIVINIGSAVEQSTKLHGYFAAAYILKMAAIQKEHSFFLITGGGKEVFLNTAGYTIIAAVPKQKNMLVRKIWYAYKLPRLLKKYGADVFINFDGACSVKTAVPLCLILPDIFFMLQYSSAKKIPAAFENAAMIVTLSQFAKNDICKRYPKIPPEKIAVMYTGASPFFLPAQQKEKEETREKYTDGKEYFLYTGETGTQANLVNLLKAFSFFKKWQKSNMQLLIATTSAILNPVFAASLKTYKYRNEVQIITAPDEKELVSITSAAYALVFAVKHSSFYAPVLQAMQSGVPVIAGNQLLMQEICGDAALFTDPEIFENIADKMMLIFKDENKRSELIGSGKQQAALFTMAAAGRLFWQTIEKCTLTQV
jgi:glycosyltransferase involved in cell wall biosynthesis